MSRTHSLNWDTRNSFYRSILPDEYDGIQSPSGSRRWSHLARKEEESNRSKPYTHKTSIFHNISFQTTDRSTMENPQLAVFMHALMDQRAILECNVVPDNCAHTPKSKARTYINQISSFNSSSTSFSRWDSQPMQQTTTSQQQEDVSVDEQACLLDRFSSSDSCLVTRRPQLESLVSPPRLPQRTTSGGSYPVPSLDSDLDSADNVRDPAVATHKAFDGSRITLNSAPTDSLGGSCSSLGPPSSIYEGDEHLSMKKIMSHRFQHQRLLEKPIGDFSKPPFMASPKCLWSDKTDCSSPSGHLFPSKEISDSDTDCKSTFEMPSDGHGEAPVRGPALSA